MTSVVSATTAQASAGSHQCVHASEGICTLQDRELYKHWPTGVPSEGMCPRVRWCRRFIEAS